jgi:hypothetical protein
MHATGSGLRIRARTLRGVSDSVEAPDRVSPPRTVILAFGAMVANVALSVVNAVMLWGFTDYLRGQFIKANDKLKDTDKNKDKNYTLKEVNHDVHSFLTSHLVQAAVFGLAMVLFAVNFRRGKGWARWFTIGLLVVPVLPTASAWQLAGLGGDGPGLVRSMSALLGLTALAVIVLLMVPESARYFAAVRAANVGTSATSGAAPVGLRGMFTPRPRPSVKPDVTPPASPPQKRATPSGQKRAAPSGQKRAAPSGQKKPAAPRAKARTSAEAAAKPNASAKNRGKSRKGS